MKNEDEKFLGALIKGCYAAKMEYNKFLKIAEGHGFKKATIIRYVKAKCPN